MNGGLGGRWPVGEADFSQKEAVAVFMTPSEIVSVVLRKGHLFGDTSSTQRCNNRQLHRTREGLCTRRHLQLIRQ